MKGEISDKTDSDLVNVFVPTTPNPTSGFLLMFAKMKLNIWICPLKKLQNLSFPLVQVKIKVKIKLVH